MPRKRRSPLVRRRTLDSALVKAADQRFALSAQHAADRSQARQAREAKDAALVESIAADYYRAMVAVEEGRGGSSQTFIDRQFGIMDHCVTLLARLTGKDPISVSFGLENGAPVTEDDWAVVVHHDVTPPRPYLHHPGQEPIPVDERLNELTAPHRTGALAHLAPERR